MIANNYRERQRYIINIITWLFVIFIFMLINQYHSMEDKTIEAAYVIMDCESSYKVDDDLNINMSSIGIYINTVNTQAVSSIRWRTVGFYITSQPLKMSNNGTEISDLSQSNISIITELRYSDNTVMQSNSYTGSKVVTEYFFPSASVYDHLKILKLDNITEKVTLYLQGIFEVYHVDSKGNESIIETNIYDWKTIRYHQGWRNPDDFAKYYNMKLTFAPGPQSVKVVYDLEYEDGKTVSTNKQAIDSMYINSEMEYEADQVYTYKKKNFQYKGFYITKVDDTTSYIKKRKITDQCKISCKVPYGGVYIHVLYKESSKLEKNHYVRELEDGTILDTGNLDSVAVGDNVKWSIKSQYILNGNVGKEAEGATGEGVYELIGFYVLDSDGEVIEPLWEIPYMTLEELKNNSFEVVEGGIDVHFVYKKTHSDAEYNAYVREWEDGTVFDEGSLQSVKVGEKVSWSIKKKIAYIQESWVERNIATSSNCYDLVKVYVTNSMNDLLLSLTVEETDIDKLLCNSITVSAGGVLVHYVYQGDGDHERPTPMPTKVPQVIPKAEVISRNLERPIVQGEVGADIRGAERFDVEDGIPTTESLYVQVNASEYLLGYTLTKKVGVMSYSVPVRKTYTLVWSDAKDEKMMTEDVTITTSVSIQRSYAYWEVSNLDYYVIDQVTVNNYALPDGQLCYGPEESEYATSKIRYTHSGNISDHVKPPEQVITGIELASEVIYGETDKPCIPMEDYTYEVDQQTEKVTVVNDYLSFGGTVVMHDWSCKGDTGQINDSVLNQNINLCNDNALYKKEQVIDSDKRNGTYSTNGYITYKKENGLNSNNADTITENIMNLNKVVIHTPVLCNPIVVSDNEKYCQLIDTTEDCVELVLDENKSLNDFTITILNTGEHSELVGYGYRDFSKNLRNPMSDSYIKKEDGKLCNEIKFPFDVYMHCTGEEDSYQPKDHWITIGSQETTFNLPMWVKEGIYTVDCRTIATNASQDCMEQTEYYSNSLLQNYVAKNQFKVEVSGRIYGFNIYDISDASLWKEVFREKNSMNLKIQNQNLYDSGIDKEEYRKDYYYNYTVGINDSYGNVTGRKTKYTLPIMNGSHPRYQNVGVMKLGYCVYYSLETIGDLYADHCSVVIKPSFWYVDENGENRRKVDLYYSEKVNGKETKLIKMGSGLDLTNLKTILVGDRSLGIPRSELLVTTSLRNVNYESWISSKEVLFSFTNIRLNYKFRTYVNEKYAEKIKESREWSLIVSEEHNVTELSVQKQRWYGKYYIPGNTKAVEAGFDVYNHALKYGVGSNEDFWLKNGSLIVNFDIYTVDQNGNPKLSYTNRDNYINRSNCCMWLLEGTELNKFDHANTRYQFKVGDVLLYDLDHTIMNDYAVEGIY